MTDKRTSLAELIASGLSGWLQLQHSQRLDEMSGEDAAQLVAAQIVNAQGRYLPATSARPPNWATASKARIDIALRTRSKKAVTWYGAIEVKWPGTAVDVHQIRAVIVEDLARLTCIDTNFLNAKFIVVGGRADAMSQLFDVSHPRAKDSELRRKAFGKLLCRQSSLPDGQLTHSEWSSAFPDALSRAPVADAKAFDGSLCATLLAKADATCGGNHIGRSHGGNARFRAVTPKQNLRQPIP